MKRVIWIVSEGSPGHISQSVGLADALAAQTAVTTYQLECRPRTGGLARLLIRCLWMGRAGRALPDRVLKRWLRLEKAIDAPPPDLIIASGGKSVFAARSLAVRHRAPLIFLGERKPYPAGWFHTAFTPSGLEAAACDVRMDVIPTKISAAAVQQAADAWAAKPPGRLWAMLVGGPSRSHHYQADDWQRLAAGMTTLARREGIRWLVTTSRRTGLEIEATLRDLLPPDIIADAVWWCHAPEKKFAAYLGSAEKLWVTQDSVSMVTEATAARKPVIVVYPRDLRFPATSFMPGYLENLESFGLLERRPISQMEGAPVRNGLTSTRPFRDTAGLAQIARERLGWT